MNIDRLYSENREEYIRHFDTAVSQDSVVENYYTDLVQDEIKKRSGRKHVILTTSGTSAITLMLIAIDVKPGDEIICTNYSAPGCVKGISLLGGIPIWCEIDPLTGNMDPEYARKLINKKTKAILTCGLYGDHCDHDEFQKIADEHRIPILGDTCQVYFSKYKNKECLQLGDMTVMSFNRNKSAPIFGTYGAVLTDNDEWAKIIKASKLNGRLAGDPIDVRGFNGETHEDKASQCYVALNNVDRWIQRRRQIADYYDSMLLGKVSTKHIPEYSLTNRHKYVVFTKNRKEVIAKFKEQGIMAKPHYKTNFANDPIKFPVTQWYADHQLSIPLNPWINDIEAEHVAEQSLKILEPIDYK